MTKTIIKKVISLLLIFTMLSTSYVAVMADNVEPPVTVFVDGKQIIFDVEPIIENGRTLVPMRFIFEALGAEVEWINETNTAIAVKDNIKIEITIDSKQMLKNGTIVELDVPAKLVNDRTLVPVRAVSEGLGAKVDWDEALYKVIITSEDDTLEEIAYSFNELSPADMEMLKVLLDDYRYEFEQNILSQAFMEISGESAYRIDSLDSLLLESVKNLWNALLIDLVMQIQMESEDNYIITDEITSLTDDELFDEYLGILKSASMDVDSIFSLKYTVTPQGKNALFIEFYDSENDNPMLITCKYIAVVPENGNIRYLTGENSPFLSDGIMLCEITTSGRRNYGIIGATKEAFLEGIDSIVKN